MPDLNEIVNSAAVLMKQAGGMEDGEAKDSLCRAANTLLESAGIKLVPGASPAPAPDPVNDDDDD